MPHHHERWALILGASSGFGAACSRALADAGFNIIGVHFDLKTTLPRAKQVKADIEPRDAKLYFSTRTSPTNGIVPRLSKASRAVETRHHRVRVALGCVRKLETTHCKQARRCRRPQSDGNDAGRDGKFAGVLDPGFGAREPAYARIENIFNDQFRFASCHCRVRCGVRRQSRTRITHTSARIGIGSERHLDQLLSSGCHRHARVSDDSKSQPNQRTYYELHPDGRMTQPEDVANTLVALMDQRLDWITGTVIRVDGGEDNI